MGLNPRVILTKKEKFKRLLDDIYNFSRVQGFFRDIYPNLASRFDDRQNKIFQELYYGKRNIADDNDKQYDALIQSAVSFLKDILLLEGSPIVFANKREMGPFEERYSYIHNPEHDGSHIGSQFLTQSPNGHVIRKLGKDDAVSIRGLRLSFESELHDFEPWLEEMGKGMYEMDGYRFDVNRFTSFAQNTFRSILIYEADKENHPILRYVSRNGIEPEEETVHCTTCGDGGCWHCEPHRFIR